MSCSCCSHMISFPPRSNITLPADRLLNSGKNAMCFCYLVKCTQKKLAITINPSAAWALPFSISRVWVSMGCFKCKEILDSNNRVVEYPFITNRPILPFLPPPLSHSRENADPGRISVSVLRIWITRSLLKRNMHFQNWVIQGKELIRDEGCISVKETIKEGIKN